MPALSNASPAGLFNPVFAKTEPTPPGVNFSMVLFVAATKRFPALSKARPTGLLNPELAKTEPTPLLAYLRMRRADYLIDSVDGPWAGRMLRTLPDSLHLNATIPGRPSCGATGVYTVRR